MLRRNRNTIDSFFAKVNKSGDCWEWLGCKTSNGYGLFRMLGEKLAHRVSWAIHYPDIPLGTFKALHRCDNRGCVNPSHLIRGTQSENLLDASRKGRLPLQQYPEQYHRDLNGKFEAKAALAEFEG